MTALAAGQTASVTIGDSGTVAIATNGGFASAQVIPVAGSAHTVNIGPLPSRRFLGPYKEGATIVLSNQTVDSMDYDASPIVAPAGNSYRSMQDALNSRLLQFANSTAYTPENTLLLGSNSKISLPIGSSITAAGAYWHTMIRTGNAEFSAAARQQYGVNIYCADAVTNSGSGVLRYTQSSQSFAWSGPAGQFGAEVIVSAIVSAATLRVYRITAANGHSIYCYIFPDASRTADYSATVNLEPVTGANAITWTRDTAARTVTENAHGRQVGDFAALFSGTEMELFGYISAITADTWSIPDTAGAGSGSGRAYGVRNVTLDLQGIVDMNYGNLKTNAESLATMAIIINSASDVVMNDPQVRNHKKYAVLVTGAKNFRGRNLRSGRSASSPTSGNSDVFHILGSIRGLRMDGIRAQAGDNLSAIATGDLASYCLHLPRYGDLSVDTYAITDLYGENCHTEMFRIYGAETGTIRNGRVGPFGGTFDTNTSACGKIMSDTVTGMMVDSASTNVDGLVIDGPNAQRIDGSESGAFAFIANSSGIKRGIEIINMMPRSMLAAISGAVQVQCTLEDLDVKLLGGGAVAGAQVSVTSTGRIKSFRGYTKTLVGNNNGGARAAFLQLEAATSQVDAFDVVVENADDISASGNKLAVVINSGLTTAGSVKVWNATAAVDSALRVTATAPNGGTYKLETTNILGTGAFFDNVPARVFYSDSNVGGNCPIQFGTAATGTAWVHMSDVWAANRLVRFNGASAQYRFTFSGCEGAAGSLQVLSGTPVVRLMGVCSVGEIGIDGTLVDSTVTNHAPGASFYNTNAAFGAGVGAYVRGATTWTRVAA